MSAKTIENTDS